ncbi:MAG: 2-oxoacid:ferredoxin oxidoreductase subunit beta [Deltaproteobacteria bacterium]|nr:2-oxoacid:ferredoxin oxidoreductase subunit beta [Deltaproteobacteria bacterium]
MVNLDDFYSDDPVAWCPGCGNYSILEALKQAFVNSGRKPHEIVIVSGIGQASKMPHYLRCNAFNGLHGRTLPVATGIKLANHELTVLAEGGDGDGYTEGGNHFIHAMRRNIDITYLVHNNKVYGLTKGQASPTSDLGYVSGTTPMGSFSPPLNPLLLAISMDCTFVARGFSGEPVHLAGLILEGLQHRGFSFIDILQNCVSFNRVNTYQWYKKRVYDIKDDPSYDPRDMGMAFRKAQEWGEKIPIGIIYRNDRPSLDEKHPAIRNLPLVKQEIDRASLEGIIEFFR